MAKPGYLNRDISWLAFNNRVLDETHKDIPLAEKVLFHGITRSNLEEFLMVRYPAQVASSSDEELGLFAEKVKEHFVALNAEFSKFNKKHHIITKVIDLKDGGKKWAEKFFKNNVFPAINPITIDRSKGANLRAGMYILAKTERGDDTILSYIEIPKQLPRMVQVPKTNLVITVEDLIMHNLDYIFKDRKIKSSCPFAILRSAEVYNRTDAQSDPFEMIVQTLHEREKAWITMLEIGTNNKSMIKLIKEIVPITPNSIVLTSEWVALSALKSIPSDIYRDNEKIRKAKQYNPFPAGSIFDLIKKEDRLAFHPFESYEATMVRFLQEAADDPNVISIKITLYRVSDNSKIIAALLRAADQGKTVTVMIELKARFDEHHNIEVSKILEEGGVRIVYTKPDIKTHAKLCLVTRMEKKGLRTYAQIGTGNYSESNAKQYTDYSLFTAREEVCFDLTRFFNLLTSDQGNFKSKEIIYAPYNMRDELMEYVEKEIKKAKKGRPAKIVIKCNAFTDTKMADKVTEAAKAGVKVIMIIRGACILQPQKNIKIFSIVGARLEHSRLYLFGAGKDPTALIGSADCMLRNLSLRNELLIVVESKKLKKRLMKHINVYLSDNVNRREILPNYQYKDVKTGKERVNCHEEFTKEAKRLALA